jgi:signal peptidase II
VFLIDQGAKALVRLSVPFGERREVVPKLFAITHARNPGGAGGLLINRPRTLLALTILAIYGRINTFFMMRSRMRDNKAAWFAFAMYAGGAASNLWERYTRGYVTDYIHLCYTRTSPVFNLADVGILKGSIGLLSSQWELVRQHREELRTLRRAKHEARNKSALTD